MKKTAFILLVAIVLASVLLGASSPLDEYVYKTVLPDTPLYENTDFSSETLISVPHNAEVEVIGEPFFVGDVEWQQVRYTVYTGYMPSGAIFKSIKNDVYDVIIAKASSTKMGDKIPFYYTHNINTEPAGYLYDGEQLRIIDDGIDYGEFYMTEYDGNYYFVLKDNVTTGLSYNQLLALIISCSFAGAIIIAVVIVIVYRRRRRKI